MAEVFAEHALELCRAGFAVIPAKGKAPIIRGFNRWSVRPSERTVSEWTEKNPDADIVFVAGLCETGKGRRGVIVVDPDDENAIGQSEELFGPTPLKVRTLRGEHHYYGGDGIDLGKIASLRPYGINIDLKHGQHGAAIIAAPPSVHEKDAAFHYDWKNCGPDVIRDLPPFSDKLLRGFLDKRAAYKATPAKQESISTEYSEEFRGGSRNLTLNDYLVSQVSFCDSFDELLDVARTWNDNLSKIRRELLDDDKVIKWAKTVWKQRENFQPMLGRGGVARVPRDETDRLLQADPKHAGDALLLLARLRMDHTARVSRGETFAVSERAMHAANCIPGWKLDAYRHSKRVLLQAGLLTCVREFRNTKEGRYAAKFTFADRGSPSQENPDLM